LTSGIGNGGQGKSGKPPTPGLRVWIGGAILSVIAMSDRIASHEDE
jgi:hypothetical protein